MDSNVSKLLLSFCFYFVGCKVCNLISNLRIGSLSMPESQIFILCRRARSATVTVWMVFQWDDRASQYRVIGLHSSE